jgi:hypothetical protein
MGSDGALSYRATYHLRSFDYYSSRNYASRLIGRKLVFYTPTLLSPWQKEPWHQIPGFRRWQGEADAQGFKPILPATRIHRTDDDFDPAEPLALHTVTSCDLGASELNCESRGRANQRAVCSAANKRSMSTASAGARIGAGMRTEPRSLSAVFRLPLDGAATAQTRRADRPLWSSDADLNVLRRSGAEHVGQQAHRRRVRAAALR